MDGSGQKVTGKGKIFMCGVVRCKVKLLQAEAKSGCSPMLYTRSAPGVPEMTGEGGARGRLVTVLNIELLLRDHRRTH